MINNIKINETPVRTSRNFNINNITFNAEDIVKNITNFDGLNLKKDSSKIIVSDNVDMINLKYGVSDVLISQIKTNSNKKIRIEIDSKTTSNIKLEFGFDKNNSNLVDDIQIVAKDNARANVILKYYTKDNFNQEQKYYHNGLIRVTCNKNSNINFSIINLLNINTDNFLSIDSIIAESSILNFNIVDFGGRNSITNYYSKLEGANSKNTINTIYLGKKDTTLDLNYISHLFGEKSNIDIEVQGALLDNAKKHFKGTIDFKKGSKKSKGNENEFCTLLSDKAKSISLPMLLCAEEDVEGNHSAAAGKVDEKTLFYIMSRGFSKNEAMKLIIRAKFNKIIEKIPDENMRYEIIGEIDRRLE